MSTPQKTRQKKHEAHPTPRHRPCQPPALCPLRSGHGAGNSPPPVFVLPPGPAAARGSPKAAIPAAGPNGKTNNETGGGESQRHALRSGGRPAPCQPGPPRGHTPTRPPQARRRAPHPPPFRRPRSARSGASSALPGPAGAPPPPTPHARPAPTWFFGRLGRPLRVRAPRAHMFPAVGDRYVLVKAVGGAIDLWKSCGQRVCNVMPRPVARVVVHMLSTGFPPVYTHHLTN